MLNYTKTNNINNDVASFIISTGKQLEDNKNSVQDTIETLVAISNAMRENDAYEIKDFLYALHQSDIGMKIIVLLEYAEEKIIGTKKPSQYDSLQGISVPLSKSITMGPAKKLMYETEKKALSNTQQLIQIIPIILNEIATLAEAMNVYSVKL